MADADESERYRTIGSAFLGKVAQRLQSLEPAELTASDVARWTDVAVKLEQAGRAHRSYDREERRRAQLLYPDGVIPRETDDDITEE